MARDRGILIYIKAILNQFGEVLQHVRGILTKMGGTLYRRVRFFLGWAGSLCRCEGPTRRSLMWVRRYARRLKGRVAPRSHALIQVCFFKEGEGFYLDERSLYRLSAR